MSRAPLHSDRAGAGPDAPPAPALYRTLRSWLRPAVLRYFPVEIEGTERLPARGPYIVAANHHNYLDGVVLGLAVPVPIAFLVMPRVYRATPLHPLFHDGIGSIPMTLERPDVGALRRALEALAEGRVVGIFPEGPFSVRGRLERGLPGVALLALRSGAPVVPAGIVGTYEALAGRRLYLPRRHPLRVRFGQPRHFGDAGGGEGRAARQFAATAGEGRAARAAVTERIMDDIASLLA